MNTNADEIREATQTLGFTPERFHRLPIIQSQVVYQSALRHFVPRGQPRWWWEHFPERTSIHFATGDGWQHLAELVPDPSERVWFIAEDFISPEYSVWEASVRDIQAVLGECYHFEYYLIHQQFRWLVCENHHCMVIGVGQEVEARLRTHRAA